MCDSVRLSVCHRNSRGCRYDHDGICHPVFDWRHYLVYHGNGKKLDLIHNTFTMKTSEGELNMRSVNATIGHNYQVLLDGEVVGNICEKLNLTRQNIVFDNFVLYVRDEKYRLVITAMAVMVSREMARERVSEQED